MPQTLVKQHTYRRVFKTAPAGGITYTALGVNTYNSYEFANVVAHVMGNGVYSSSSVAYCRHHSIRS